MTGRPIYIVPASLWLVLVSPPLTQFCVLSRCHKFVLSHQERYPWSLSCRSSFFPVELSKFEYITSLERIDFLPNVFDKYLSRVNIREIDAVIWDTMSTSLVADSGHLASEAFSKEFACFTRFVSCHRDLLRVSVRSFSHVLGRWSTSFTNNLEHVTTFFT